MANIAYGEEGQYTSGDTLPIKSTTGGVELLFYELDPALRDEFLADFYPNKILPWLKTNGATRADVWTVERDTGFQLVIVSSAYPKPWEEIEGLKYYLNGSHPLKIKSHPYLNLP